MTKLEEAKQFARNMRQQMTRRRHKALLNTDKEKSFNLHHEYMEKVIEFFSGLKKRGFRTTNIDEPGRVGRIVPITKKWIKEQLAKETDLQRLQRQIRNTKEDSEEYKKLTKELIHRMAAGET